MKRTIYMALILFVSATSFSGLMGCREDKKDAGDKIEDAFDDADDKIEEGAEEIEDEIEDATDDN